MAEVIDNEQVRAAKLRDAQAKAVRLFAAVPAMVAYDQRRRRGHRRNLETGAVRR